MKYVTFYCIIIVTLWSLSSCKRSVTSHNKIVQQQVESADWPIDKQRVWDGPRTCGINDSVTFTYIGIKCRLLGLVSSNNTKCQANAERFLEEWLVTDSGVNILHFINSEQPLYDVDGVPLVWVTGNPERCLNLELAASGFVDIDADSFPEYSFKRVQKSGPDREVPWISELRAAHSTAKARCE